MGLCANAGGLALARVVHSARGPSAAQPKCRAIEWEEVQGMAQQDCIEHIRAGNATLPNVLASIVAGAPDRELIVCDQGIYTRASFAQAVDKLGGHLRAMGVGPEDRVMVLSENHIAHPLTLFACAQLGAIFTPINPAYRAGEIRHALTHSTPRAVLVSPTCLAELSAALIDSDAAPQVMLTDGGDASYPALDSVLSGPASSSDCSSGVTEDMPCCMIYTSGTTGNPKGVLHAHRSYVLAGLANAQRLALTQQDSIMVVLPFFHVNALFYSLAGAVVSGARLVIRPRFSATRFWEECVTYGVTTVNIIESIGAILLARPQSEFRPDHRLRIMYGVRARFEEALQTRFRVPLTVGGFGMTEVPGATCTSPGESNPAGSIGRPADFDWDKSLSTRCMIADETGQPMPDGTPGELLIQAPTLMKGYFNDPEATGAAFREGWLCTGDLVVRDQDGTYRFISRLKDVIRRRGENIAAAEIEDLLRGHPEVADIAAVAIPSEMGEDEILAVIVPDPSAAWPDDEKARQAHALAAWSAERIARNKVPRYYAWVEVLPLTSTHKVAKQKLRADATLLARAIDTAKT